MFLQALNRGRRKVTVTVTFRNSPSPVDDTPQSCTNSQTPLSGFVAQPRHQTVKSETRKHRHSGSKLKLNPQLSMPAQTNIPDLNFVNLSTRHRIPNLGNPQPNSQELVRCRPSRSTRHRTQRPNPENKTEPPNIMPKSQTSTSKPARPWQKPFQKHQN